MVLLCCIACHIIRCSVATRKAEELGGRTERAKLTIKGVVAPDAAASQQEGTVKSPLGSSDNPSSAIFTVANLITFCRFVLTVVFLVLFAKHDASNRGAALACYAVAASTDFLDGQVARRTQTVSWLGKVMDPLMDRFLLFTGVAGLVVTGELPLWIAVFVFGRDIYLGIAAMVLRRYTKRPLDVVYVGKAATALLMTGFVDLLLAVPMVPGLGLVDVGWLPGFNNASVAVGMFFVYAGIVCSSIAVYVYMRNGLRIRRRVIDQRRAGKDG